MSSCTVSSSCWQKTAERVYKLPPPSPGESPAANCKPTHSIAPKCRSSRALNDLSLTAAYSSEYGASQSAAARSKCAAASMNSAAKRGPDSHASITQPAQHSSPHGECIHIIRRRPCNPRRQRFEPLVVLPLRFGHLGALWSRSIRKAFDVAHAQSSEPVGKRSLASRYRCAASTRYPELESAAPRLAASDRGTCRR